MFSVYETHMYYVNILLEEGEEVLQPEFGKPMNKIHGYIKTQIPHKDAGSIFQDENGTFGLFIVMGAKIIKGLEWQELGLCDSRCRYEWMSPETYQSKSKSKELTKDTIMDDKLDIIEMMDKINKKGTPETIAMGLILKVLLDIREQNNKLIKLNSI